MLWLKALHLITMVCWFAGLFYLPRLFVYHAMSEDEISRERFKIMERKLYRGIMTPAMIATVIFGGTMIAMNPDYYFSALWMQLKLGLLLLLIIYHFACGKFRKDFAEDKVDKNHIFFRWFNEVPVIFLIAIIFLAVLKPL